MNNDRFAASGLSIQLSRRGLLHQAGVKAAALLATAATLGCSKPAQSTNIAEPGESDDALLARLLASDKPHIPYRDLPYQLTRTLMLPAGSILTVDPDTRFFWNGPTDQPIGVFEAAGDDTGIEVRGNGRAIVACPAPSPLVYAAAMHGRHGFSVVGIEAHECQHVMVGAAGKENYTTVRTQGVDVNVARNVRISGGGARYTQPATRGEGACKLAYVIGCHVSDVRYENVSHGIQWWGGDAGLEPWQNGARSNERKCVDLVIERASVHRANAGGIWGSMGRRITVRDCSVEECLDVGFDAEGCVDTIFERCTARNGHNGCFTTFALCDGVRFVDCRGVVDNHRYPLFRTYNITQNPQDNRVIQVTGGHFECTDPTAPGTMDTAMGPAQDLTISGATLANVRIDTAFSNMHLTRITGNDLSFPYPLGAVAAIRAGASKGLITAAGVVAGSAIVQGNRITYTAVPTGRETAILLREDDFNSTATSHVADNTVSGPFATGISIINATANIGIVPVFEIKGNRFDRSAPATRLLAIGQEGPHAKRPFARWNDGQTRNGRGLTMAEALR